MERAIEAFALERAKHIIIYGAIEEFTLMHLEGTTTQSYIQVHTFIGMYRFPQCHQMDKECIAVQPAGLHQPTHRTLQTQTRGAARNMRTPDTTHTHSLCVQPSSHC